MKILMIVHGFLPECQGGTESYVLAISRQLQARGHEVEVLCGSHEGAPPEATAPVLRTSRFDGLRVHRVHRTGLYVDAWERSSDPGVGAVLRRLLREGRFSLVHVHHWIRLSRHLVEISHEEGVPAVVTLHDLWTTCPIAFRVRSDGFCDRPAGAESCFGCAQPSEAGRPDSVLREELDEFAADLRSEVALARRVIVPSNAHKDLVRTHHPEATGRIRVLPHGSISPLRRRAPRGNLGQAPLVRIAHWGHLSKLKGIDLLLQALRSMQRPEAVRADIFGKVVYPGERAEVAALAEGLPVTFREEFRIQDLPSFQFDLAVIPTRCSESHSFVLDEAFLLGLPVVVPDRGALAERLSGAGASFRAGDAADLARVLDGVVADPAKLRTWAARIPGLHRLDDHVRDLDRLYREVQVLAAPLPRVAPERVEQRGVARVRAAELIRRRGLESAIRVGFLEQDLARAGASLDEMQRYHLEKDREIVRLQSELERAQAPAPAIEPPAVAPAPREEAALAREALLRADLAASESRAAALRHRLQAEGILANQRVQAELEAERATSSELRLRLAATEVRLAGFEPILQSLQRRLRPEGQEPESGQDPPREAEEPILLDRLARTLESLRTDLSASAGELEALRRDLEAERAQRRVESEAMARDLDSLLRVVARLERQRWPRGARAHRQAGDRIRILMVIHQFLPRHAAGTEIATWALARELSKRHDVVIFTAESDHSRPRFEHTRRALGPLRIHQVIHNYRWHGFRDTYDSPEADAIFRRVLAEERPDIVHIQHLHHGSANFITIAKSQGIPVVFTLHDYWLLCPRDGQMRRADGEVCARPKPAKCRDCIAHFEIEEGGAPLLPRALRPGAEAIVSPPTAAVLRSLRSPAGSPHDAHARAITERLEYLKAVVRDVDLFLAPSAFLRDLFVASGFLVPERIEVADNGYAVEDFLRTPRTESDGFRVGYLGTIAEHKGVHVLVEAMNRIEDPAVSCRIWGELSAFIEYSDRLRGLIRNPRTLLMGAYAPERAGEVLAALDLLVIPSLWYENAPLTIREAALAGVPVLASDIGALPQNLVAGVTGELFPPGDPYALARAILAHSQDPRRRSRYRPGEFPVLAASEAAKAMESRYLELLARTGGALH